jgi:hypothetical protein
MIRADVLSPYFKDVKGMMVEIGVHHGTMSEILLRMTQDTVLYCVDPYKKFEDGIYKDAMNDKSQEEFDQLSARISTMLTNEFGPRVCMVRKTSEEAVTMFPDASVSFVYIDGNHGYSHVFKDIEMWLPKIKPGGVLTGDDVCDFDESKRLPDGNIRMDWGPGSYGYYGVYKALCDIREKYGKQFEVIGTQFVMKC